MWSRQVSQLCSVAGAALLALAALPAAAPAQVARAADPATHAACRSSEQASRPSAHIPTVVSGVVRLAGCVADQTGIEHLVVDWVSTADDARGRICTDPAVGEDGSWSCTWDTRVLPPGPYEVQFAAIDLAGNRGTFERRFDVTRADDDAAGPAETARPPAVGAAAPVVPPAAAPTPTAPEAPAAPAPSPASPTAPDPPAPPAAPPAPDDPAPITEDVTEFERELAFERMRDCMLDRVKDTPTASPEVVTLPEQAQAVRACLEPALELLGARVEGVDAVPEPPAVRAVVADGWVRDRLARELPELVAGVPLLVVTADELCEAAGSAAVPCDPA